jgi:hypothetical protein
VSSSARADDPASRRAIEKLRRFAEKRPSDASVAMLFSCDAARRNVRELRSSGGVISAAGIMFAQLT